MKLVCPGCGAVASADSFLNDELCRETLAVIARLPAPMPKVVLGYLSLFRPRKQSLTWKKALRLSGEVEKLISTGYVKVQGKIDRSCPPSVWARAMEQMVEQRNGLELPIKSHRYLCKVAWGMADQADYHAEKTQTTTQMSSRSRQGAGADPGLDPLEKARREYDAKHGSQNVDRSSVNISDIIKGMD